MAIHPPKPGDEVGVAIRVDVPQVEVPRYGRRRGIDRVNEPLTLIIMVNAFLLPEGLQAGLGAIVIIRFRE
jgi:hypothetical protein